MKKTNFFRHFVETLPATSLLGMLLLAPMGATAQVTIGSGDLPQATLDIVGTYPTDADKGKAFRLDDGNQAPGKVLTCGENAIGTWEQSGTEMIRGVVEGSDRVIPMADYPSVAGFNPAETAEVEFISYTLPPGVWMLFFYIPLQFDFTDLNIAQVRIAMGFAPEDNSNNGCAAVNRYMSGVGVVVNGITHRNLEVGVVTNSTSGDVKYTLRLGYFAIRSTAGTSLAVSNNILVSPTGVGSTLYAIRLK